MKTRPLNLTLREIVGIRGTNRRCVITQILSGSKVGVRDVDGSGPPEEIAIEMLTLPPPVADPTKPEQNGPPNENRRSEELAAIKDSAWEEAKLRLEVIKPFLHIHRPPTGMVKMRAAEYGVHFGTVYDWIAKFKDGGGELIALVGRSPSVPRGTVKLSREIEELIREVIEKHFLTPQRKKIKKIFQALQQACAEKGIPLVRGDSDNKLHCPHINTVRARVNAMSALRRILKREGPNKASQHTASGEGFVARWPLEYVQIDHTKADVILICAKTGRRLGRPWITIAIDVFSRVVVGFYVSFDPPGALATGLCLSQAILPKEEWLRRHADYFSQVPEWPSYGKPVYLHCDNAREFRGKMLERACDNYDIHHVFRPVRQPQYGAHIERFMGTMAGELKSLPGATFSNSVERGKNYDSEAEATMTLDDFLRWFSNLILCKYHYETHSALNQTPLERWNQAFTEGTELAPPLGSLPERYVGDAAEALELNFLPVEERTISGQGVVIELIRYTSPSLRRWFGAKDPKHPKRNRYFIFHFDPRDMSYIYFWNPDDKKHEKIPYRDMDRPPVTLWEWRAAREFLVKRGTPKHQQNESMVFEAVKTMRMVEEAAASRKGKMKAAGKFKPGVHRDRLKNGHHAKQFKPAVPVQVEHEPLGVTDAYEDLEVIVDSNP